MNPEMKKLQCLNQKKIKKKSDTDNAAFAGIEVVAANKTTRLDEYNVLCDN